MFFCRTISNCSSQKGPAFVLTTLSVTALSHLLWCSGQRWPELGTRHLHRHRIITGPVCSNLFRLAVSKSSVIYHLSIYHRFVTDNKEIVSFLCDCLWLNKDMFSFCYLSITFLKCCVSECIVMNCGKRMAPVSCIMSHISCYMSHVSCLKHHVSYFFSISCLMSYVSCLTYPVSHLCLRSPVSSLLSQVSCLMWSPVSRLLSHVSISCLLPHLSCLLSHGSSLIFHISCLTSPVSSLLSHISCLMSLVSYLLSHVSYLTSPVSFLMFHVSCVGYIILSH